MGVSHRAYWSNCWAKAWAIMPRHSATLLCKLLGYSFLSVPGKNNRSGKSWHSANNRIYVNCRRGSKPRKPEQARLLEALAGPHGKTVAKVMAIQRGIKFK